MKILNTRWLAIVLAMILVVIAVGCGKAATIDIPSAPVVVDAAGQDVRAAAAKALIILNSASIVVETTQTLELQLACVQAISGQQVPIPGCTVVIPATLHRQIDGLFRRYAEATTAAADAIEQGAITEWAALRARVDPVLTQVEALARLVQQIAQQADGGGDLSTWLLTIQSVANQLVDLFPPADRPVVAFRSPVEVF